MADPRIVHTTSGSSNIVMRDYSKGNWTLQETMVLIEAKKMDDERRSMKKLQCSGEQSSKPTELRWKWVEDYCWKRDCFRSQNQCNDKWDNLMRDYKKVRDYQRRLGDDHDNHPSSYWKIEKNDRKDRNLPTSMLQQIYQALAEAVEKNGGGAAAAATGGGAPRRMLVAGGSGEGSGTSGSASPSASAATSSGAACLMEKPISVVHPTMPPMMLQQNQPALPLPPLSSHHPPTLPPSLPPVPPLQPPPSLLPPLQPPPPPLPFFSQPQTASAVVDSDTSEHLDSPAKRRRRALGEPGGGEQQQQQQLQQGRGATGTRTSYYPSTSTSVEESSAIGSAILRSASIIMEAIHASEERVERRHRELLSLHERRLKVEETKVEVSRQGINGLVQAINNLADSILTLASEQNQSHSRPQPQPHPPPPSQ